MAVITINKKQFEKDIGNLNEEMQNKIALFGTPVEQVNDSEIHLEVFPNRPDLLSYHGFKRSFLAFLGKKRGLQIYNVNKPEKDYTVIVDSSVKDVRPHTVCAIVRDMELDDEKIKELIEIQEKLHITVGRKRRKMALGIYPLEKIKLPITFRAIEPDKIKFIPLESEKELSGLEILQKHPAGKEYSHLLAGKAKFPVFMDAEKSILSMPPIINSQLTGKITEETKDMFVECSGFDIELLKICLNIIVTTMAEMGGRIYAMEIKSGMTKKEITPDLTPKKMKVSLENTNRLLGLNLKEKNLKELAEKMGYNYKHGSGVGIVEIPSWRIDILHEVDIIEDIAIAYGYENFVPEIPEISTIGKEDRKEVLKKKFSGILSGTGFLEVSNYHLTNNKEQGEKMNVPEKKSNFIYVENSKTEYNILRGNLSHFLLKNLSENVDSEYPQKIAEIGKIFVMDNTEIREKEMLSAAITPGNFTEAKQAIEYFFKMIGKNESISFKEPLQESDLPEHFIGGRTAEVLFNRKTIGFLGEIHPKILRNWKIKMPVSLFEIEIDDILKDLS